MTGVWGWCVRIGLFVVALLAPAIGYWIRALQTGNAEFAIDGLGWGLIGAVAALILFAISFRTTAIGRLGRLAVAAVSVLAVWSSFLGIANL